MLYYEFHFIVFKSASNDVCQGIAATAKRICTSDPHPDDIRIFWCVLTQGVNFHSKTSSSSTGSLSSVYKRHEDAKKRAYGQRIKGVEHGIFTPLVFSTTGGMGGDGFGDLASTSGPRHCMA